METTLTTTHCVAGKEVGVRLAEVKFSRASLIRELYAQTLKLEKQFGFQPGMGYSQIAPRSQAVAIAYGEYITVSDLLDELVEKHGHGW